MCGKKKDNHPREINVDTIRELRQQGKHEEANALLAAWRDNTKRQKKQVASEISARDRKVMKHLARKRGLCWMCLMFRKQEVPIKDEGYTLCADHSKQRMDNKRKYEGDERNENEKS